MSASAPITSGSRYWTSLVFIGLLAGFLSGIFGVGGGTVIVPALVMLLHFDQRLAAGTSLTSIILPAIVGMIGYAAEGNVDWIAGIMIALGSIVGAYVGSWLLQKLPVQALRWLFIIFLLFVAINLFASVPNREGAIVLSAGSAFALLGLGLVVGVLASLLGVGGGIIIVPALMLMFGVSDLVAKGTSLFVILPTSASGTIGNLKRHNTDLRAAAVIGPVAAVSSYVGVWSAHAIEPKTASILFACFIILIVIQMIFKARKRK